MKLTRWSGRKYLQTAYLIKGQYPEIIKPPTIQQEQSPEQTNLQMSKCAFFFQGRHRLPASKWEDGQHY